MYPVTNKELTESNVYRSKDQFFNLVRVERGEDDIYHIFMDADLPLVTRNDTVRDEVKGQMPESRVISRGEIKGGRHSLGQGIRTLGVGLFPWLRMADGEDRLVLLQRDAGALVSPLAHMYPAGLVAGDHPVFAMFREATEETCVFSVDHAAKVLMVQSFSLPEEWDVLLSQADQDGIIAKKQDNKANIMKNLKTHHPDLADYDVRFADEPLPSQKVENYPLDTAVFYLPDGKVFSVQGLVCDDPVNNSIDFAIALRADVRHLPLVKNVDPEVFGRKPKLSRYDEVMALEIVTAMLQRYREVMDAPSQDYAVEYSLPSLF